MSQVPLGLRNTLYKLFIAAHEARQGDAFDSLSEAASSDQERDYIRDRTQKFRSVLVKLRRSPPLDDPFLNGIREASLLFNEGLSFDAHEILEDPWKEAVGDKKILLQGLIQAAAN